jgi:hypothetical protein
MRELQSIDVRLETIKGNLLGLAQQLNGVENVLLDALRNLDNQAFVREYGEYYGYYQEKHQPMSQPEFNGAEAAYVAAVSLGNASPQVDTTTSATPGGGTVVAKLRGSTDALTYTALPPDEINFALGTVGAEPSSGPVINPQLWLVATSAYLDLANQPMSVTGRGAKKKVKASFICKSSKAAIFQEAGNRLMSAMTNVALTSDSSTEAIKNPFFRAPLDGYAAALDTLFAEMDKRRSEAVKTLQFDPWLSVDQPTSAAASLGTNPVVECAAGARRIGSGITLSSIGAVTPLFANASHFTQKDNGLSLCISDLSYSTKTVQTMPGQFRPRPRPPRLGYTLAIRGVAHIRYRQSDLATCTFTSDPFFAGTMVGAPEPDIFAELTLHWFVPNALPQFSSIAPKVQNCPFAPVSDQQATVLATNDMNTLFAGSRRELIRTAWYVPMSQMEQAQAEPQLSLAKLADYKAVLWALAQIALPSSFESDQVFHSYLADADGALVDRVSLITKLGRLVDTAPDSEVQQFDISAYERLARSQLADFQNSVSSKLSAAVAAGGDIPAGITGGLAGLAKVSGAYAACQRP